MDHDWPNWMWAVYFAVHWVTAACYIAIPAKLKFNEYIIVRPSIAYLFQAFIMACGAHHFIHPIAMFAFGGLQMFLVLVAVDSVMAVISALTVWKLHDRR